MPRRKLTATFLDREIKTPEAGQVDYFDTATKGFGVRTSYNGTKSFFVMGTITSPDGKREKIRITLKPPYDKKIMSVETAREKARKPLELMRNNIDPRKVAADEAESAAAKRADTYGKAVKDFVDKFHRGKKKNKYWKEPLRLLLWPEGGKPPRRDTDIDVDGHLWRRRPVSEITDIEIVQLLDRIVAADKGYTANRVHAAMATFFKWCKTPNGGKRIIENPMANIERPFDNEKPRERVFDESELKALWAVAENIDPLPGAFLKLLILTGKRRGAVVAMRWDEISDDWVWTPGPEKQSRNKKHFPAPLPPLAQRILSGLPTIKGNPHIFFGRVEGKHLDPDAQKPRIKKETGINDFGYHAIKHTVETKLAEGWDIDGRRYRVPPHVRDLALDHVLSRGSGTGYDHHDYQDEIKEALEKWADRIESLVMPQGVRALR